MKSNIAQTQTSNMKVEKVGFLLERLAEDCAPLQYVRELTQNAVEAIQKLGPGRGGDIFWGLDPYTFEDLGVQKLCLVDTGIGMSGEEMIRHINNLSSSGGLQSLSGNYGLGAKISAATRNKAGMIYASWRNKQDPGAMAWLWRDPETGEYGLKRIEAHGEYFDFIVPDASTNDALKPDLIKKSGHGTVVILLGDVLEETNTFAPFGMGTEWIAKYLEDRYFEFPANVNVRSQDSKSETDETSMRPVYGRSRALADLSKASGVVELKDASARWWILDPEAKTKVHSSRRVTGGYSAALYQNELYEPSIGTARRPRLQSFGCTFSYNDVVIFVEPKPGDKKLTTNTARTSLLINGEPLPWEDWANEFRMNMPQEIRDLEEVTSAATISGHRDSIQQRLAKILGLFKLSRYRPVTPGTGTHDILTETLVGQPVPSPGGGGEGGGDGGGTLLTIVPKPKKGTLRFGVAAKEGNTAVEVESQRIPEVRWLPTGEVDETLEDRAAYYEPRSNTVMANSQFRVFTDMIAYWNHQYNGTAGAEPKIVDVVREAFEQQMIETVLGLQSLKNRRHWTQQQIESAWSSEGLTAAVMARSNVLLFVGRVLKTALGSNGKQLQRDAALVA